MGEATAAGRTTRVGDSGRIDLTIGPVEPSSATGAAPSLAQPLTTTTVETYDAQGRLASRETIGDGDEQQFETWEYSGLTITYTAPDGQETVSVMNLAGLPLFTQRSAGEETWETTSYAYDVGGLGHTVNIQAPNGELTARGFDATGALVSEARPGAGAAFSYSRDEWGRMTGRVDPDGDAVFYCYDAAGDLKSTRRAGVCNGPAIDELSTFEYDELGRVVQSTRRNAGGDVVVSQRAFDLLGRTINDSLEVGGDHAAVTSNFVVTQGGWRRDTVYPTGAQWSRESDRIGRLVGLSRGGNDVELKWTGELYAGRKHTLAGGATTLQETATLDGLGRRVGWDFTSSGGQRYEAEAARDVSGRIASLSWQTGANDARHWRGYEYDARGRLAGTFGWDGLTPGPDPAELVNHEVAPGDVAAFAAGLAGSIDTPFSRAPDGGDLLGAGDAYEVTSPRGQGHRLTSLNIDGVATSIDHDFTGRVTEIDPGLTLEYDPDERLMAVRDSGTGDVLERYAYDAAGRLAATYDDASLTQRFGWDGAQMVGALTDNNAAIWDAAWGGSLDQLVEFRDLAVNPGGGTAVLPIADHRNSPVAAVEATQGGVALPEVAEYGPMGRTATFDSTDDDAETCREEGNPGTRCTHPGGLPFGFAGAWRSEATGLVYMRFRWYSPKLGQFLTPDPLGEVDSFNLYAYVDGDPINRWDPWGLSNRSLTDKPGRDGDDKPFVNAWSPQLRAPGVVDPVVPPGQTVPVVVPVLVPIVVVVPAIVSGDSENMGPKEPPPSGGVDEPWPPQMSLPGEPGDDGMGGTPPDETPMLPEAAAGAAAPPCGGVGQPPCPDDASKGAVSGFNATESAIIHEARGIVGSPQFEAIRRADAAGESVTANIGGRIIQYEPGLPASGMTMFGENGFLIGREAFSSSGELGQTVLHELYRLNTSASAQGVSAALAAQETQAAASFAARALKALGF